MQFGGGSHVGYSYDDVSPLGIFARYWYGVIRKQCWWSDGQNGYYFTNLRNNYMSTTHIHIYDISLDEEGNSIISFTAKFENIRVYHGSITLHDTELSTLERFLTRQLHHLRKYGTIET